MSRFPIRLRLTLAFVLAMAVVLVATGAFLYLRLGSSLDEALDESLQARATEVTPQVVAGEPVSAGGDPDDRFVQVLDPDGGVVDGTTALDEPILEQVALGDATQGVRWYVLDEVPGVDGRVRVLAKPVETPSGTVVLLVGASLEDRDDAVRELLALLLVVGPAALLVASLLGYALATAALRPVESMQAEAADISASQPGRRLPLPHAHDEIYRLGETLNEMLGRLEAALERERGFVADAGHELRTPLTNLKAELELALRRPRTEAELVQAIRSAAEETERLSQLADDLLLIARSDQRQLPLRRKRVSVDGLLRTVADRFGPRAHGAGRTIDVDAPAALEVSADAARLEQAVGNVVDNALTHGAGAVHLSAAERDGSVELHVRDDGSGFPAAFLPHAFDRFNRADDSRSEGGTGLGLAIAAAIAAAHGGSAHAANRDGTGADVWLVLPKR
jgi:heavy metal sensor kinase